MLGALVAAIATHAPAVVRFALPFLYSRLAHHQKHFPTAHKEEVGPDERARIDLWRHYAVFCCAGCSAQVALGHTGAPSAGALQQVWARVCVWVVGWVDGLMCGWVCRCGHKMPTLCWRPAHPEQHVGVAGELHSGVAVPFKGYQWRQFLHFLPPACVQRTLR